MKVDKESLIGEVLNSKPNSEMVFEKYGLTCADCMLGEMETIEEGAKGHGLHDEEIKELVKELNSL